jgi:hypothetical protein
MNQNRETDFLPRARSARKLARAIAQAELPESYVRTIPAESLFLAIKECGLTSAVEIIESASIEQLRAILDLDLWQGDSFNEEQIWEWLSLPEAAASTSDDPASLTILQKILKGLDLKLVALLFHRHVVYHTFEEPTDQPPAAGFFTPDKGYTWLGFKIDSSDKQFLLGRLMALIFESNADLFYQLLAIPNVSTPTMIEEESYQDASRRLQSEGFPELADAIKNCSPLPITEFKKLISDEKQSPLISDIRVVEPLVVSFGALEPLESLVKEIGSGLRGGIEQFEIELTKIMNSALLRWKIPLSDINEINALAQKARGAINLGLQLALQNTSCTIGSLYESLGLLPFFRLGIWQLFQLQHQARALGSDELKLISDDSVKFSIIAHLSESWPILPKFLALDGTLIQDDSGKLLAGWREISSTSDVDLALQYINNN